MQVFGKRCGIIETDLTGIGGWHHHRMHLISTKRIDRKRRHQCRVNAAGQSQNDAGKAIFVNIITQPQHDPAIECRQIFIGRCNRPGQMDMPGGDRQLYRQHSFAKTRQMAGQTAISI